ncbi:TIGR01777 family protein [Candidatus Nomurabacteria bacterium]|nr:TIGR01777 family protein [Candidatus Nomurabacteria bacterium]
MTIVVAGGSGLIGTALIRALLSEGHTVVVVDKRGPRLTHEHLFFIPCDLTEQILPFNILERTDAVINLVGSSPYRKWTPAVKKDIYESRVVATKHLIESLSHTVNKPSIVISASSTALYAEAPEDIDERGTKGNTFLSDVTAEMEQEAFRAESFGCRVVVVRLAPVLAHSGFLAPLWRWAQWRLCIPYFKKDHWMSWIHLDDAVAVYRFALETHTLQGVVNATAPTPVRYKSFMKTFRRITKSLFFGRSLLAPLRFGREMLRVFALNQRVVPQRLLDKGFSFAYPDIASALEQLYEKN